MEMEPLGETEFEDCWNSATNFLLNQNNEDILLPILPPLPLYQDLSYQDSTATSSHTLASTISNNWKGAYNFDVFLDESEAAKNQAFSFDTTDDKIYVKPEVACPFNFVVTPNPPEETIIRAKLMYASPEHQLTPVKRCPVHASHQDASNNNFPYPDHIIRGISTNARYEIDGNNHMSFVLPYTYPPFGTDFTIGLYKFMCLSSCNGGINRRSLKLIFTLENKINILGTKVFPIRVCACPKRDRTNEGKKILKRKAPSDSVNVKVESVSKKHKVEEYTIKVTHLEDYKVLKTVRDALEFKRKYNKDDP